MLISVMNLETNIEIYKKRLAILEDFSLNDLFVFLDKTRRNLITFKDFGKFLNMIGSRTSNPLDLRVMFDQLDLNKDGFLGYEEFCKVMLPFDKSHLQCLLKKKNRFFPHKSNNFSVSEFSKYFGQEVKSCLRRIFDGQVER